ncbi:hypothetical protein IMCC3135_19430 [Granulosicoccus antarcticus IMCC3135]|uniref:Uncharacterized protein n=1 Tax=Granulosicoccus antarcticus IMCC3135 TaxID=1192854 RepID=A0A2Z2NTZ6_9GAMM|nr:hypothetical protein IMCC3135_19430 [Granulosicoccus antarcticus IMCC3135]
MMHALAVNVRRFLDGIFRFATDTSWSIIAQVEVSIKPGELHFRFHIANRLGQDIRDSLDFQVN